MRACVCARACARVCVCVRAGASMHARMCMHAPACMQAHVCGWVGLCLCVCVCVCVCGKGNCSWRTGIMRKSKGLQYLKVAPGIHVRLHCVTVGLIDIYIMVPFASLPPCWVACISPSNLWKLGPTWMLCLVGDGRRSERGKETGRSRWGEKIGWSQ